MADQNIYILIDGSGSMGNVKHDVLAGINDFISEQQIDAKANGTDVKFSLTTFDSSVMEVYDGEDLSLVQPLTLGQTFLGGGTALLDAMGKVLTNAEDDAAPRNIVVVYTDGEEWDSHEFTHEQISKLIEKLTATGKWQFVYLGAEFGDFQKEAAQRVMAASATMGTYSAINTAKTNIPSTMRTLSNTVSHYRNANDEQLANIAATGLVSASAEDAGVDWNAVDETKKTEVKEPKGK
jgi:uncharacterized protein YegL